MNQLSVSSVDSNEPTLVVSYYDLVEMSLSLLELPSSSLQCTTLSNRISAIVKLELTTAF